jgi:hypothetical protein
MDIPIRVMANRLNGERTIGQPIIKGDFFLFMNETSDWVIGF